MLYLASRSPRRRELLSQIGVRFAPIDAGIDETVRDGESPEQYVERMARGKARAGFAALACAGDATHPVVLGADTAVVAADAILGKPRDRAHGLAMLRCLAGAEHRVLSGVCVIGAEREEYALSQTRVCLRPIDEAELAAYWASGEGRDKAGAYAAQGLGAVFIEALHGSYSGVVGLPLFETAQLLRAFAIPLGFDHE